MNTCRLLTTVFVQDASQNKTYLNLSIFRTNHIDDSVSNSSQGLPSELVQAGSGQEALNEESLRVSLLYCDEFVNSRNIEFILGTLQWRFNERDGVSNHQPHDCLLKRLIRRKSKKTPMFRALAFVRGIHRSPVNSPYKGPVTRKMFPFDDGIMKHNSHFPFPIIYQHWDDEVVNMVADDLTTQENWAPAAMLLAFSSRNIPVSAPEFNVTSRSKSVFDVLWWMCESNLTKRFFRVEIKSPSFQFDKEILSCRNQVIVLSVWPGV